MSNIPSVSKMDSLSLLILTIVSNDSRKSFHGQPNVRAQLITVQAFT